MALYTRESIDRLRDTLDIVELISTKTELKRAGSNRYSGLCPFHDERTPSFSVNPVEKVYYCFGCQAAGDVFQFVQETEGLDFKETVEYLADRYRVQLEEDTEQQDPGYAKRRQRHERFTDLYKRATTFYERYFWESDEAQRARSYLTERGFAESTLKAFHVGYSPDSWQALFKATVQAGFSTEEVHQAGLLQRSDGEGRMYDRFRGRIMFPLSDARGRPCGFGARALSDNQQPKYLNSAENEFFQKGKQLYGMHLARSAATKSETIILVEGYLDVLALHQIGIENVVCSMGTALTLDQIQLLARLAPNVYLAFDADRAGWQAMRKASQLAFSRNIKLSVIPIPAGADPADIATSENSSLMHELLTQALPIEKFLVETVLKETGEGNSRDKDAVVLELSSIFQRMPDSVLRHELVQNVAQHLEIPETLLNRLLNKSSTPEKKTSEQSRHTRNVQSQSPTRQQHVEQSFLVVCLARPDLGKEALKSVDLQTDFADKQLAVIASQIAQQLEHPTQGLPEESVHRVAELVVRASALDISDATFEVERLQFLLHGITRKITLAKEQGKEIVEYARERVKLRAAYDQAVEKAMGSA